MSEIKIEKLSMEELEGRGVFSWPIWEKEVSEFDWTYEALEECFVLEGKVEVSWKNQNILIEKGQFVTFEKGLKCYWNIIEPIRKHYNFPS